MHPLRVGRAQCHIITTSPSTTAMSVVAMKRVRREKLGYSQDTDASTPKTTVGYAKCASTIHRGHDPKNRNPYESTLHASRTGRSAMIEYDTNFLSSFGSAAMLSGYANHKIPCCELNAMPKARTIPSDFS